MSASSGGIGGDGHETVTTAAAGGSSPVTYTERSQPAAKTAATVPSGFRASVHDAQSLAAIAGQIETICAARPPASTSSRSSAR